MGRLFDPFFRADAARSPGKGGHGLGLAIAAGIVRRHQGSIEARNAEPGLEVVLHLPVNGPGRGESAEGRWNSE